METLGHSQISLTLDTYSHVMPDLQAEAATQIDAALTVWLSSRGGFVGWCARIAKFRRDSGEPGGIDPPTRRLRDEKGERPEDPTE